MVAHDTPGNRLSLAVVIDAVATRSDLTASTAALASLATELPVATVVTTATPYSSARVFTDLDADIIAVVSPNHVPAPGAFRLVEEMFAIDPGLDVLFGSDDDRAAPYVGFAVERLRTHDYLGGLIAVRGNFARRLAGLNPDRSPYHRWDLALRAVDLTRGIACSPRPLATAAGAAARRDSPEARRRGRLVLHDHLTRCGIRALVETTSRPGYFQTRRVLDTSPMVSVIVPSPRARHANADQHVQALEATLDSIIEHSPTPVPEILVITDDSMPSAELRRMIELCEGAADVLPLCRRTSTSWRHVDIAVSLAEGEMLLIVDDTTVIASPDWISTLTALAADPSIGAAFAVSDRVRACDDEWSIQSESDIIRSGCVAMRRDVFCAIGGFPDDESGRAIPLALAEKGLSCVHTPQVRFHEHAGEVAGAR